MRSTLRRFPPGNPGRPAGLSPKVDISMSRFPPFCCEVKPFSFGPGPIVIEHPLARGIQIILCISPCRTKGICVLHIPPCASITKIQLAKETRRRRQKSNKKATKKAIPVPRVSGRLLHPAQDVTHQQHHTTPSTISTDNTNRYLVKSYYLIHSRQRRRPDGRHINQTTTPGGPQHPN